ncbi:hypothetical protein BCR33DRAFT_763558, partial [Rhizoclosmatium globosum]
MKYTYCVSQVQSPGHDPKSRTKLHHLSSSQRKSQPFVRRPFCLLDSIFTPKKTQIRCIGEFIDGDMLEGVWRSLSTTNKMAILDEIRENVKALQSKTFTSIGGWKLADNETPVLGEYWSGNSFYESEVDFLIKELDANLKSVKSMESSSSDLKDAIEGIAALRYDILCALQALTPAPVVLFHGDFAFRNIIVKKDIETDQFSLAAILDWEWCGTRPLWLDWIGDWLEEDTAEDELENKWIRSEMKRDGFPIFENLDGFKLRSVVYDLTDSIAAWRLEGDDISRAVKRIG